MTNSIKHQLHLTDCIEGVKSLPDNSLDLVLSGPPYFDHVIYSDDSQNLSTKNYNDFLDELKNLWGNIEPKLRDGGVIALWLHDVYIKNEGYFELKPFHADIAKTMPENTKLRNILIWDRYLKKTYPNLPESKQFGTRFQYILLFSKGKTAFEEEFERLYWNPIQYFKTQPTILGSKVLYKIIFLVGKNGFIFKSLKNIKKFFIKDKYEFTEYLTTCPPEVSEMIIENFSREGDTICDPFLGSGTTMMVADNLDRNCIGFEINEKAKEVIVKKVSSQNIEIL
jgi:DNA modification methylase